MKNFILSAAIFFSAFLSAQQITSIENKGSELYINNSITLKKVRISKFIYQLEKTLCS